MENWYKKYAGIIEENHVDINDLTDDEQILQIRRNPKLLKYLQNPSRDVLEALVRFDGGFLQQIKNPDAELEKIAVESEGNAIRYVYDQTPELQMIAVKSRPSSIIFVQHPTEQVIDYLDSLRPH